MISRKASREGISRSPLSMHPCRDRVRAARRSVTIRARSQCASFGACFSTCLSAPLRAPLIAGIASDFIRTSFVVEDAFEQRRTEIALAGVGQNRDDGLA